MKHINSPAPPHGETDILKAMGKSMMEEFQSTGWASMLPHMDQADERAEGPGSQERREKGFRAYMIFFGAAVHHLAVDLIPDEHVEAWQKEFAREFARVAYLILSYENAVIRAYRMHGKYMGELDSIDDEATMSMQEAAASIIDELVVADNIWLKGGYYLNHKRVIQHADAERRYLHPARIEEFFLLMFTGIQECQAVYKAFMVEGLDSSFLIDVILHALRGDDELRDHAEENEENDQWVRNVADHIEEQARRDLVEYIRRAIHAMSEAARCYVRLALGMQYHLEQQEGRGVAAEAIPKVTPDPFALVQGFATLVEAVTTIFSFVAKGATEPSPPKLPTDWTAAKWHPTQREQAVKNGLWCGEGADTRDTRIPHDIIEAGPA